MNQPSGKLSKSLTLYLQFAAALQEQDKILLDINKVTFDGPTSLKQFYIASYNEMEQNEPYRITLAVNFNRIFSYHLTNTYLPTLRWYVSVFSLVLSKLLSEPWKFSIGLVECSWHCTAQTISDFVVGYCQLDCDLSQEIFRADLIRRLQQRP